MRTLLPAALLLLVPFIGHAQDTLPNYLADHAYFGPASFETPRTAPTSCISAKGWRMVPPTNTKDTTKVLYRMLWRDDQHGGRGR